MATPVIDARSYGRSYLARSRHQSVGSGEDVGSRERRRSEISDQTFQQKFNPSFLPSFELFIERRMQFSVRPNGVLIWLFPWFRPVWVSQPANLTMVLSHTFPRTSVGPWESQLNHPPTLSSNWLGHDVNGPGCVV